MSDTTVGSSPGLVDSVAAYVREVRFELADLPVDDVDDLTGGMEADLSELAAESGGDLIGRLGTPRLYAAELRAAAGLPAREDGPSPRRRPLTEAVRHLRASFARSVEQRPWLQSVTAFLVTLRPAWWLIRGYLAVWVVWGILGINHGIRPRGFSGYALALMAIVVSVQLGRGWLRQWALLRPLIVIGNAAAIIVAVMVWPLGAGSYQGGSSAPSVPGGVSLDGQQLGNIYVYDTGGKRVTGVRLFAEDGRPLNAGQSSTDDQGNLVGLDVNGIPADVVRDVGGTPLLNVYPRAVAGSDPWQVAQPEGQQMGYQLWTPPLSILPLAPTPAPTPTLAPTPTPTPTSAVTKPVPTSSVSATPSGGSSPSVTRSGR